MIKKRVCRVAAWDSLEARMLCALQTIDFSAYSVKTAQLDFLTPLVHTTTSGFSYTLGTGNGQRTNANGVTWPDSSYYESTLGTGGFDAINAWPMRAPIVYASANPAGYAALGWNYTQDMVEGATCVDDAGRAAVTYADDYLLDNDAAAFERAKEVLGFVGYMTTRQGSTYNFAWLDAPTFFGASGSVQAQDKNYVYRVEYNKRTAYPTATPTSAWDDPLSTPSQIVGGSSNPQAAQPFRSHAKYSIYMNDLRDVAGNDVAPIYDGPLYTSTGAPAGVKAGIKETETNSTQQFGFDEVRAMQGFAKGLAMVQKFASLNGGLVGDNLYFARFCENELNRLIGNFSRWLSTNPSYDTKLASAALSALDDYSQLRDTKAGLGYGQYRARLAANSNTPETTDDSIPSAQLQSMIDTLAAKIQSKLLKTNDYRNGIFMDDAAGANWESWGELQIYALARTYEMKIAMGQTPDSVSSLLDDASYAADEFYGKAGWHYKDEAAPNLANTNQRTLEIVNGTRITQTGASQIAYGQSSIVLGLEAMADAWSISGRSDAANRTADYLEYMRRVGSWFIGNNTQLAVMYDAKSTGSGGKFSGIGAAFDGLGYGSPASASRVNRNSGAESNVETLDAWIHLEHAISIHGLSTTLVFDNGLSSLVEPVRGTPVTIAKPRKSVAADVFGELAIVLP